MLVKQNNKIYQVKFKHKKIQTGKGIQDHLITYLTILSANELRKLLRFLSKYSRANKEEKIKLFKEYKNNLLSLETLEEPLIGVLIAGLLNSIKNKDIDDNKTDTTTNTTSTNLTGLTIIIKNRIKKLFGLKSTDEPVVLTKSDVANRPEETPEQKEQRLVEAVSPTKAAAAAAEKEARRLARIAEGKKAPGPKPLTAAEKEARRIARLAKAAAAATATATQIKDDPPIQGEGIQNFLKTNISNIKKKFKNMSPKLLNSAKTILKYFIVYQIGVKVGIIKQMTQSLELMLKDRKTILDISAEIEDKNLLNQILDKIERRNPRMYKYLTTNII
jgi:hypothetical protein